jgi:hypothetical protein
VYTVPFGVMVPKMVDNLLLPVPVSGSHIGFSTIRMEPCWMALGQASGIAASLAIDHQSKVKNIDLEDLQNLLIEQKATLVYYRDVRPEDQDFKIVQFMGLRGYLPGWEAKLNGAVDQETADLWEKLSEKKLYYQAGKTIRRQLLMSIYNDLTVSQ